MAKRPLRIQRKGDVFICSNRCLQNQPLIPIDEESSARIVGTMAKCAQERQVTIYAFSFLPRGFWLLLEAPEANRQNFMRDFQSWLACWANDKHDREGKFFHHRYNDEAILDAEQLVETYVDVVVAPVREGLTDDLDEYTGATSWALLTGGGSAGGTWIDRDKLRSLRRTDPKLDESEVAKRYDLAFTTPPIDEVDLELDPPLGDPVEPDMDDEAMVQVWFMLESMRRVRQILAWQQEQEEAGEPWRRDEPHPCPEEASPFEPIGPPKYRYGRTCRSKSSRLHGRYRKMRRAVRKRYTAAMSLWRKGKSAFCGCVMGDDSNEPPEGDKHGEETTSVDEADAQVTADIDFPTSTIPPGWLKTRRPLRKRPPAPPPDEPAQAA